MARREKKAFDAKEIDQRIASLQMCIRKLNAIKAGMKQTKQPSLTLDYGASMDKGVDLINDFCDGGLRELRNTAPRGERPWDEWDV